MATASASFSQLVRSRSDIFRWPVRLGGSLAATTLAWCLLLGDLGFLLIHLSHRYLGYPSTYLYNIGIDLSHPEFYQYAKEAWCAFILLYIFLRFRRFAFLAWSALFGFLLIDDAVGIHEALGGVIVTALNIPGMSIPGIGDVRGQDFGEILSVLAAAPIFACIVLGYFKLDAEQQEFSRGLVVLVGLLGFFGVVIDFFVHAVDDHWLFFIEDGGEMIVMSVMLWFIFRYHITARTPAERSAQAH